MLSVKSIKPIKGNPLIGLMDKIVKGKRSSKSFHFEKISDTFYRGNNPTVADYKTLAQNGIKRILNLKTITNKEAQKLAQEASKNGMEFINIPLNPFYIKKSFGHILNEIKTASTKKPLFIHCTFGKDRTGFVSGLAKFLREGVPMNEVIKDMESHNFAKTIFGHMENYLKKFGKNFVK